VTENQTRTFKFVFNEHSVRTFQEHYTIEVWCDGRDYDPLLEAYCPRYSYKITANDGEWEYIANDISGAANEKPDNTAAAKSLFAFLIAAQEGLPEDVEGKAENADTFPPHVREFAYLLKEEILNTYAQLEKEVA
jgi:hypothetical protein